MAQFFILRAENVNPSPIVPFNRHFYEYEPPRPLAEIEEDINKLEKEILAMLSEVTS